VRRLIVKEGVVLPGYEKLIGTAYLSDGSIFHFRERYSNRKLIKYSYHLMKGDKIMRWDNVPHHKEISTYPHHKHENDQVIESPDMDIEKVLKAIEETH